MYEDPVSFITRKISPIANDYVGVVVGLICPETPYNPTTPCVFTVGQVVSSTNLGTPLPLSGSTPFNIGSLTKIFAATMQACRNPADPPTSWGAFGDPSNFSIQDVNIQPGVNAISLLDMATYRSGFPTDTTAPWWYQGQPLRTIADLVNVLDNLVPNLPQNPSGGCYSYSDLSWGMLALCNLNIQSETAPVESDWKDAIVGLLRDTLKLDMPHTFPFPYLSSAGLLPAGCDADNNPYPASTNYSPVPTMLAGSGDLTSTGYDMYQWLAFHMGYTPGAVSTPVLKMMQQPYPPPPKACDGGTFNPTVGLGWMFDGPDQSFLWKNGEVLGFTAYMAFQPWVDGSVHSPTGVFVLTNTVGNPDATALGGAYIRALLGIDSPDGEFPERRLKPA